MLNIIYDWDMLSTSLRTKLSSSKLHALNALGQIGPEYGEWGAVTKKIP